MDIRKNVNALTDAEKRAFVAAIFELKRRRSVLRPADPLRSRYDDYVQIHLDAMNAVRTEGASWGHMGPAFGPWHRVLLRQFELDLQSVQTGVTIPYWDWTDPTSRVFSNSTADFFLGGDGDATGRVVNGPFRSSRWIIRVKDSPRDPSYLRRQLGRDSTAPRLPSRASVNNALPISAYDTAPWNDLDRGPNPADWGGFRVQLEVTLHNLVHRYIGGTMALMTSPNDPVFWLHHANIDRIWAQWQDRHGMSSYPTTGAPRGHNRDDELIFSAGGPRPWPARMTPADTFDRHAMDYRYDTDPEARVSPLMAREEAALKMARMAAMPVFPTPEEVPGLRELTAAIAEAPSPDILPEAAPMGAARRALEAPPSPSKIFPMVSEVPGLRELTRASEPRGHARALPARTRARSRARC